MTDVKAVTRYDFDHPACTGYGCCGGGSVVQISDGKYVGYADYFALFRELKNAKRDVAKLRTDLICAERQRDQHAKDAMKLLRVRGERRDLRQDADRLNWFADEQVVFCFAGVSPEIVHELAIIVAERYGRCDPTVDDRRLAFRVMIDEARIAYAERGA